MKAHIPCVIHEYVDSNGVSPYGEWLQSLEKKDRAKVISRIDRMELGHLGDHRSVGDEVWELKFRSGHRVYYTQEGRNIYLLLGGGDKSNQDSDIEIAKQRLDEHRQEV